MMTEAAVGSLVVAGIYLTARVASYLWRINGGRAPETGRDPTEKSTIPGS